MSTPTSAGDALRDLFRAHARPAHIWLPILLVAIAKGRDCPTKQGFISDSGAELWRHETGTGPDEHNVSHVQHNCTGSAYVGGFVVGRLYEP